MPEIVLYGIIGAAGLCLGAYSLTDETNTHPARPQPGTRRSMRHCADTHPVVAHRSLLAAA